MICSNGTSLDQKEEVEKFLLAAVARFKAFKTRVPSKSLGGKRPQGASEFKAKSSILSELSGLENVLFNDFIDDELDADAVSEQRASASLPDSVPIESERAAREEDEMAALDAVGNYEADPTVMLEDVSQDIVFKTLKVSCACVAVLMFVCVCVCARATSICVRENLYVHFLNFVCVCVRATGKAHRSQVREWVGGWSYQCVIKACNKKGPHAGKFSVKYKDDPNWRTHSLLREGYGKEKHWVLLRLLSRASA
jgi:hypothetical protein